MGKRRKRQAQFEAATLAVELAAEAAEVWRVLSWYRDGGEPTFGAPIRCPECGALSLVLRVEPSLGRTKNRCSDCGHNFVITSRALDAVQSGQMAKPAGALFPGDLAAARVTQREVSSQAAQPYHPPPPTDPAPPTYEEVATGLGAALPSGPPLGDLDRTAPPEPVPLTAPASQPAPRRRAGPAPGRSPDGLPAIAAAAVAPVDLPPIDPSRDVASPMQASGPAPPPRRRPAASPTDRDQQASAPASAAPPRRRAGPQSWSASDATAPTAPTQTRPRKRPPSALGRPPDGGDGDSPTALPLAEVKRPPMPQRTADPLVTAAEARVADPTSRPDPTSPPDPAPTPPPAPAVEEVPAPVPPRPAKTSLFSAPPPEPVAEEPGTDGAASVRSERDESGDDEAASLFAVPTAVDGSVSGELFPLPIVVRRASTGEVLGGPSGIVETSAPVADHASPGGLEGPADLPALANRVSAVLEVPPVSGPPSTPDPVSEAPPGPTPPATGPLRVVLVEDDPNDAALISALLKAAPDEVELIAVSTRAKGEAAAREIEAEVILLDLDLPDSHGLTTITRWCFAEVPGSVIVMSGDYTEFLETTGKEQGITDFMAKSEVVDLLAEGPGGTRKFVEILSRVADR